MIVFVLVCFLCLSRFGWAQQGWVLSSGEASQAMEGKAIIGEDGFGGEGSGDAGTAVTAAGSRADVDRPSWVRVEG